MNTQTLLTTIIFCASTTEDELQNAKNALNKLYEMKKRCGFSFMVNRAIRRQKKLIAKMESEL